MTPTRRGALRRLALGTFVTAAMLAGGLSACSPKSATATATADDMVMGDPKAPVEIVEYASLSCSHCATFSQEVFPGLKEKYIDTGKVRYVFREFLTAPADVAAAGALLARCAGEDKYFSVVDAVFRGQAEMFSDGTAANALPVLQRIGQSVGLSPEQFNACVGDEKALEALNKRVEGYAKSAEITATPTFFVDGKKLAEGEVSLERLEKAIAEAQAPK